MNRFVGVLGIVAAFIYGYEFVKLAFLGGELNLALVGVALFFMAIECLIDGIFYLATGRNPNRKWGE